MAHSHWPVFRVVRAGWQEPLDASFSQSKPDRRWNTQRFPALYCCCSVRVARAVARDLLGLGAILLGDLQPEYRPRLLEIHWHGTVADVTSPAGVQAAGFTATYPMGVEKSETQRKGAEWFAAGLEGVVCRSASLARLGQSRWTSGHEPWGELAIFVSKCEEEPQLVRHRDETDWLDSQDLPRPGTLGTPEPQSPG